MPRQAKAGMFFRMMMRAALVRKGRATAALLAVVVAAAVATAMLNLYVDVQAKLQKEFRNYGANLVINAREGNALAPDALSTIDATLSGHGIAVPFTYAVANTANGKPVVVAGTDFDRAQRLNRWWGISQWPSHSMTALVGSRAVEQVAVQDRKFDLSFDGKPIHLSVAGMLSAGGEEDSRIYISLSDFHTWTGLPLTTVEVGATGTSAEIEAMRAKLASALPGAEVKPIRQIVEAEGRVLSKARASLLASAVVITVTTVLCVLATLTAWVLEQRKNFAIMKALGASERIVIGFFAAEAATLGAAGALLGFVVGLAAAAWIAHADFHSSIAPRLGVLPIVFAGSILLALVSALVPIGVLRRVQPATILRGE